MATRSLRVRRLMSPQWGRSDPPSAASAWARPRQKKHNSWPSEDSIGSAQERQSRVIFESKAHRNTAGEEKACPLQCVDHATDSGADLPSSRQLRCTVRLCSLIRPEYAPPPDHALQRNPPQSGEAAAGQVEED
ncbi:hypothetical protein G5714_019062 [Onychostoma macrolepis]|uniref:Uncharacterized protein n=1 Tax=Onychostoma macrolepis TaxID=369639 RepID=A0A7J6C0U4_9TELE|nr:hypothetical protein G5714_019062 [Onychostoma macrolepis]